MQNAGRHLAILAREKLGGKVEGKRIIVLAGRGNDGGGGLVAARRLVAIRQLIVAVSVVACDRLAYSFFLVTVRVPRGGN